MAFLSVVARRVASESASERPTPTMFSGESWASMLLGGLGIAGKKKRRSRYLCLPWLGMIISSHRPFRALGAEIDAGRLRVSRHRASAATGGHVRYINVPS